MCLRDSLSVIVPDISSIIRYITDTITDTIMAKDKSGKTQVTRVDLRIPNHTFEQIEEIAKKTDQPLHHRTGKIITTPVILNLIHLGLKAIDSGDIDIESIASKESLMGAEIEKKILDSLDQKIEIIVSDKLTDILAKQLDTVVETKVNEAIKTLPNQEIEQKQSNKADLVTDSLTDTSKLEDKSSLEDSLSNDRFDEVESASNSLDQVNQTEPILISNNEPQEQKANENDRYSLNQTQLASRFGYKSHTQVGKKFKALSKENFINWTKGKDPDRKGWYKIGDKFQVIENKIN